MYGSGLRGRGDPAPGRAGRPRRRDPVKGEKYVLNCPRCGPVVGLVSDASDEPGEGPEAETVIEEEVVDTPGGPAVRVRCPRCGQWIKPDQARPA